MSKFNKKFKERESQARIHLKKIKRNKRDSSKKIWFHSSSMGEFEQAKPIIEKIKGVNPDIKIIVTFYSPSGYDNQKNYPNADEIYYLPFDSLRNAQIFINCIRPALVVFVRYDLWYNFIYILKKNNIPIFLICATKPINTNRFLEKIYFKSIYNKLTFIHTIGKPHKNYYDSLKINTEIVEGNDTRFDRIINIVENKTNCGNVLPINYPVEDFIIVAGSTWEEDDNLIINSIPLLKHHKNIKFIIVPHEPNIDNISRLKVDLPNAVLLSECEENSNLIPDYLIIDKIGLLIKIYSIAKAVWVGGGFGKGVHSVAEPAGYGLPIAVGNKFTNSPDAINLYKLDVLSIITTPQDFANWIDNLIENHELYKEIRIKTKAFIYSGKGESNKIANMIINRLKE